MGYRDTMYGLVSDYRNLKRECNRKQEQVLEAVKALTESESKKRRLEHRIARSLHMLGRPVVDGSTVFLLDGVGSASRLRVIEADEAILVNLPDMPADLAEEDADTLAALEAAADEVFNEAHTLAMDAIGRAVGE